MTSNSPAPGHATSFAPVQAPGHARNVIRILMTIAFATVILILGAGPARADPARPTNYLSEVTEIDPLPSGVHLEITGGDSFLQVTAAPGHTVLVPGYFNEPYVRIDTDNTVWVNQNSPAFYINQDRYGTVSVPPGITGQSDPQWVAVAVNGSYAWHDHRVHWMSYDLPPTVAGDVEQQVFPWEIPIVIDGADTTVRGDLLWLPSHSPIGPVLAGILALLPLAVWGTRFLITTMSAIGIAAVLAAYLTIVENTGTPVPARGFPWGILFPAAAVIAGVISLALSRSKPAAAHWAGFVAGLLLLTWSLVNLKVLWMPVLVSGIPAAIQRAGVGIVIWASLAVITIAATAVLSVAARNPRRSLSAVET